MNRREQAERSRLRKNAVTIISGIMVVIVAIVAGLVINAATAQERFENEITVINLAYSTGNTERINEVLGRKVSSGDYGRVEESLKKYLRDLTDNMNDINKLGNDEELIMAIDAEYLAKTRDDLTAVKNKLAAASEQAKEYRAQYEKLFSEDGALSYLPDNLDEKYRTLFRENASGFYEDEDLKNNYHDMIALLDGALLMEIDAIDYLDNNLSDWYVKDDTLVFKVASTENGYEKIRNNMSKYTSL